MSIHDNVFDLLDAAYEQREITRHIAAMPEWEKRFLLGYMRAQERHLTPIAGDGAAAASIEDGAQDPPRA